MLTIEAILLTKRLRIEQKQ